MKSISKTLKYPTSGTPDEAVTAAPEI